MKYVTTPISFSVHGEGDDPVIGDSAIHVKVVEEGAGPFVELRSMAEGSEPGQILMDVEQLDLVAEAARKLMAGMEKGGQV